VLLVEDSEQDAELIVRELKRAALDCECRRVQTPADFERELKAFRPHVILSDFSLPAFSGLAALGLWQRSGLGMPFIFVSGTIGEESVIEAVKAGAHDYVMKTNLARLAPAIQRELRDAEARRASRAADAGLRRAQQMARLAHIITAADGAFERWSTTLPELIGLPEAQVPANTREWLELVHPDDRAALRAAAVEAGREHQRRDLEYRLQRPDATWLHIRQTIEPLEGERDASGATRWFSTLQDVSEQKRAEEAERRSRLALDTAADMVLIIERTSMRFVDVNEAACALLGYTREELLALGPHDVLPVSREELESRYDEMIASPAAATGMNSYYRCKDGSQLPFESTRRALRSGDRWYIVAISRDIRERIAAEQALRESASLKGAILASSLDAHVTIDHHGEIVEFNPAAERIFGFSREQAIGRPIAEAIIPPRYREAHRRGFAHYLATGVGPVLGKRIEIEALRADGSEFPVELAITPIKSGATPLFTAFIRDITERKEAEAKIRRLNRVYAVLSGINAAIARARDREELFRESCRIAVEAGEFQKAWLGLVERGGQGVKVVAAHGAEPRYFENLQAMLKQDAAQGKSIAAQALREHQPVVANDVEHDPRMLDRQNSVASGSRSLVALPLLVANQAVGLLVLHARVAGFFDDEEMKLLRELAGDLGFALENIARSEKLDYLAYYDALTGLANRTLFVERLEQQLAAARRAQQSLALFLLDLERFKAVNDALGRQAGDELLKELTVRMLAIGMIPHRLARMGADHFALMGVDKKTEQDVARLIEMWLKQLFDQPFEIAGRELRVAARVGIALYPNDGDDPESLLRAAEAALKKAKASGERYLFHTEELTGRVAERLSLENELRRAADRNEFVLHYQPKVDIDTRELTGVEALIRWQRPGKGLVPPAQFIPLLEETGLILQVGTWALRRAALDHRRWAEQKLKAPRIAVNVSQIQLRQRDFVAAVEQAILEGIAPTGIDLEITESLVMEDVRANIEKLKAVRGLGMSIAIDDFGTGYSSLGYLAQLPVEYLKIDRSFVSKMHQDADAMSLVSTIISLAHSLRLKVVAEGVETEEQAKFLRLLRCDEMQGYLFGKPVPESELIALLPRTS
jgi:PAS domain S-box-containing protein/diguanylate cyclase (GGDEF)-like protein